jgi:folate-binding protein YgfZ
MSALPALDAAYRHAACFDLSACAKIELAGPEARLFLHNLCTNDVKNLPPGAGCEIFLTTNKARIIGHAVVGHYALKDGPVLLLDAAPGEGERLLAHLNHYHISEQVELADRTAEWSLFRVVGPGAREALSGLSTELNALAPWHHLPCSFAATGDAFVRRQAFLTLPGYDILCLPADAPNLRNRLRNAGVADGDPESLEVLRIESGLPKMGVDMDDQRFVVETDRIAQSICYTKGCFLGQEPIVMARDRGQVNRHLRGLLVRNAPPPAAGTKIFRDGSEVGIITSAVHSPRLGHAIALGYLKRGNESPGVVVSLGEQARVTAEVSTLPFA